MTAVHDNAHCFYCFDQNIQLLDVAADRSDQQRLNLRKWQIGRIVKERIFIGKSFGLNGSEDVRLWGGSRWAYRLLLGRHNFRSCWCVYGF